MPVRNIRKSSKERIYEDLLERIQHCDLLPGSPINETVLLKEYGVSKTPIREALNLLYQDHLVDIFPQSGTFVSKIDLKRVEDLIFLRFSVENEISRMLLERHDPLNSTVDRILTLEELAMKDEDWREAVRLDYAFHEELFKVADRGEAWTIIEKNVLPYYSRLRFYSSSIIKEHLDYPLTHIEHIEMAQAIREGDSEKYFKVVEGTHNRWFKSDALKKDVIAHPEFFVDAEYFK